MKNNFKILIIVVLVSICYPFICSAQKLEEYEIRLLARPTADSIMLRWAPLDFAMWQLGNKHGYKLTRTLMIREGEYIETMNEELLTAEPLKPKPLNQWEELVDTDDYAGVVAQAIYGDDFEVSSDNSKPEMMSIVNRAREQENRFGFALFAADQSLKVAEYSGLYFCDKNVKKGDKYLYRLMLAETPKGVKVDTAFYFTGSDEYMPLPAPTNVKAEPGDKEVTITWDNQSQEEFYGSYWIEKSINGGASFEKAHELPLVNTTPEGYDESKFGLFIDSLANNKQTYQYRVIGISLFGELSPPSKVVELKGKNRITSIPRLKLEKISEESEVKIDWEFTNDKNELVEGFKIFRSKKYAEGFELLKDSIPVMQRSFTDKQPLLTGYYRIQAYNSDGGGPYCIPKMKQLIDSIPPSIPLGLKAVVDTTGRVKLTWTKNTDADIFGYRVYRGNSRHEEFSQLTNKAIKQAFFYDHIALKTLTKKVFYKIVAVDQRQNQSGFSEIFEMERPDIVPPASPFIKKIISEDNGLDIKWIRSSSDDVDKQLLYRNIKGKKDWSLIKNISADSTHFFDQTVEPDMTYRYLLLAVDKAGNESKPTTPVAGKFNGRNRDNLWILPKVKRRNKTKETLLQWETPNFKVNRYMIYYKNKDGLWRLLDGVAPNNHEYVTKVAGTEFKIFCKGGIL